ncbi:MAG: hypothetical protein Q4E20_07330 [Eubacteriales bacterium]|nr:hypothetical protein [Eubacteriales bacterium]
MKKRALAIPLIIGILVSLAACGADYEAKGYKDMKAALKAQEEKAIAEQGEESYYSSMRLAVALFGGDIMELFDIDPADLMGDGYDKLSEEQKEAYVNGAKRAIKDWLGKFAADSN